MGARAKAATISVRGLKLAVDLRDAIQAQADLRDLTWSAVASELLDEAIRTRRSPGVAFVDGVTGRRAVLAGTGLDIWEVIDVWHSENHDDSRLAENFSWLTPAQIRAALDYYRLYPEEIDRRLEIEAAWTVERVRESFPIEIYDDDRVEEFLEVDSIPASLRERVRARLSEPEDE